MAGLSALYPAVPGLVAARGQAERSRAAAAHDDGERSGSGSLWSPLGTGVSRSCVVVSGHLDPRLRSRIRCRRVARWRGYQMMTGYRRPGCSRPGLILRAPRAPGTPSENTLWPSAITELIRVRVTCARSRLMAGFSPPGPPPARRWARVRCWPRGATLQTNEASAGALPAEGTSSSQTPLRAASHRPLERPGASRSGPSGRPSPRMPTPSPFGPSEILPTSHPTRANRRHEKSPRGQSSAAVSLAGFAAIDWLLHLQPDGRPQIKMFCVCPSSSATNQLPRAVSERSWSAQPMSVFGMIGTSDLSIAPSAAL